ncbi:solute:sodium symporter family transporter [Blastopirellula marina]|uniref:Solute:sodium symporter family transporter n=1 Tax=Blastopirellula marina TaxID=124 RepID=A0A2S8GQB8_9BACT|nr:solute:sodium symporter family transporter [Blastopirellula marina]PQO46551.1 solute:sodium symporter family transporter [Blastopirellula marina]
MLDTLITLVSFVFFTALVGAVTWWLTRKDDHGSSAGYFLAGRTLTGGYIAGSLMLTNLSTEQLVGLNGAAFNDGICVMAWEVIAAVSLVIMALFFLPRYLKSGIATVPEFLEDRHGDSTRAITSLIFIVAYAGILLPIILYTGAKGLTEILDIRGILGIGPLVIPADAPPEYLDFAGKAIIWGAVWLIGIIGSIYAIFGGLRTVAVSDTLNGFGLLVGGFLIVFYGLNAVSDEGIFKAVEIMQTENPEKFNSLGSSTSSVPFTTLFSGVLLLNLFYWCTNQQIIQRTFGASSLKEGQRGVLMAGALKVFAPLILVVPGLIAFNLYGDEIAGDAAYGKLVQAVLPTWLVGFFAAVIVGAILSSFNSALNSTATLFSLGVYKQMLHPDASEKRVIASGKVFGTILALVSMTMAPLLIGQKSIFGYLQKMNGLYFIPIFAVVLVGMLSKRAPKIAADIALIFGFVGISIFYFVIQPMSEDQSWDLNGDFYNYHFLGLMFLTLVGFQLVMAKAAPRETSYEQKDSGQVDMTSWPLAWPMGLGLIVIVLSIYIYFANPSVIWPLVPPRPLIDPANPDSVEQVRNVVLTYVRSVC